MKTQADQATPIILYIQAGNTKEESPQAAARRLAETLGFRRWRGWFEPFPGLGPQRKRGAAEGFHAWTNRWPEASKTPKLAEIRLGGWLAGGGCAGLHIVRDEGGPVCWFAFSEQDFPKSTPVRGIEKIDYSVLPRRDATRRFFTQSPSWLDAGAKLRLVEYWQSRQLLAWMVLDAER
jgi:hypothetical protein